MRLRPPFLLSRFVDRPRGGGTLLQLAWRILSACLAERMSRIDVLQHPHQLAHPSPLAHLLLEEEMVEVLQIACPTVLPSVRLMPSFRGVLYSVVYRGSTSSGMLMRKRPPPPPRRRVAMHPPPAHVHATHLSSSLVEGSHSRSAPYAGGRTPESADVYKAASGGESGKG